MNININPVSELAKPDYMAKLSPSFFKWLQESLLCFDLKTSDEILSSQEYFRKLIDLLSINPEMLELSELVGLTSSLEIMKEIFKIIEEAFKVSPLTPDAFELEFGRFFRILNFE